MVTLACPWCAADLPLEPSDLDSPELSCSGCNTAWLASDPIAEELAAAA
jgi:hypothetical protein